MRVLIVNKSSRTGGAAVAASRLMDALINNGVKAKMLVADKDADNINVVETGSAWSKRWAFLWERLCIFLRLHLSRKRLFEVDIANSGLDITNTREFEEADIIHLHWINQGMLSLKGIEKILKSGKPVVWTMHDAWPSVGICHLTANCDNYTRECGLCRLLPGGGSKKDLSYKIWKKKKDLLEAYPIHFVACSRWLADKALHSGLLQEQNVTAIPNTLDRRVFMRRNKMEAKDMLGLPAGKKVILFAAQKVTNRYKGMSYLVSAINKLAADDSVRNSYVVALLGGGTDELARQMNIDVMPLGYISDEKKIVEAYNAADVFVLPSLEDNLPNTIMEAMACGTPCVGFDVGGIPEMIDHKKNGYVARYKDPDDLAEGIQWVVGHERYDSLSDAAVAKVAAEYSQSLVAKRYIDVYNDALKNTNYYDI